MEIRKQLDEVLDYFRTPFEQGGLQFDSIVNKFDKDNSRNFGHQLKAILEKLERDKLIFKTTTSYGMELEIHYYHITIEGRLFEGYVQQNNDELTQKGILANDLKRRIRNDRFVVLGAVWAAIAAIGLLIVETMIHGSELYWTMAAWFGKFPPP
jgi:hypothetical protein